MIFPIDKRSVLSAKILLTICYLVLSMEYARVGGTSVECTTSGTQDGCSDTQTFPCLWQSHQCAYRYDYISLQCMDVPWQSEVSIVCSTTTTVPPLDTPIEYEVNILDNPNYINYYGEMNDGRTCLNGLCDFPVTGLYEWSGMTANTDPESYWIVIDKQDAGTCLDITCTVEIA